jgi:hypothetical protein
MIVFVTDAVDYQRAFELAENVEEEKLACRVARSIGVHPDMPCNELWQGPVNEDRAERIVADFVGVAERTGIAPYTERELAYIRAAMGNTVEAVSA